MLDAAEPQNREARAILTLGQVESHGPDPAFYALVAGTSIALPNMDSQRLTLFGLADQLKFERLTQMLRALSNQHNLPCWRYGNDPYTSPGISAWLDRPSASPPND